MNRSEYAQLTEMIHQNIVMQVRELQVDIIKIPLTNIACTQSINKVNHFFHCQI